MRIGNQMYDRLIVSMNEKTYQQREVALKEVDRLIKKTKESTSITGFLKAVAETGASRTAMSEMTANVMVSLLLPAVRAVNTAHARSRQTRQNLEVAFALAEWKLKNGSYPKSLDQLVPKFLDEAPFDTFTGKPLKYIARKKDSSFTASDGMARTKTDVGLMTNPRETTRESAFRFPKKSYFARIRNRSCGILPQHDRDGGRMPPVRKKPGNSLSFRALYL